MDGLQTKVPVVIGDRVVIGETDITDALLRFACEIGPDGAWCSFQLRADVEAPHLEFPHTQVRNHLGDRSVIEVSVADIDAILDDGGFATTGGEKIHDWLRAQGVIQ